MCFVNCVVALLPISKSKRLDKITEKTKRIYLDNTSEDKND